MSLQHVRDARMEGLKPAGVVLVVVGPMPRHMEDDAELVIVSDPAAMDWRSLIGVWVALLVTRPDVRKVRRVVRELEAAGAKLFGYADANQAQALYLNADEEAHDLMRKTWETACLS